MTPNASAAMLTTIGRFCTRLTGTNDEGDEQASQQAQRLVIAGRQVEVGPRPEKGVRDRGNGTHGAVRGRARAGRPGDATRAIGILRMGFKEAQGTLCLCAV